MNVNSIYKLGVCLLISLFVGRQEMLAQNLYNLSFQNVKLTADPLQLTADIMISFDQEGKLGSSNLIIEFDPAVASNPQMVSKHISSVPTYQEPTFLRTMEGAVSLNIELVASGTGDEVGMKGNEQKLARISFDLHSTDRPVELRWFQSSTRGTVVYSDDVQFTRLNPGNLENLTVKPSDFPAGDLILTAVQKGLDAQLVWEGLSISQGISYEVERSLDGQLFEIIGSVSNDLSLGTAEPFKYLDEGIVNKFDGIIFYRLKQKKRDGSYILSNTVELSIDDVNALNLQAFPNPVKDDVKIQWIDLGGKAEITLIDAKGKVIKTDNTEVGQSQVKWNLSELSAGLYFIEYNNLEIQNMRASVIVQVER